MNTAVHPFPQRGRIQPSTTGVLSLAVVFLMAITSGGLTSFPKGNPSAQPLQCGWFCSAPAARAVLPWALIFSDLTGLSKITSPLFGWESSKENTGAPGNSLMIQSWHNSLQGRDPKPIKNRGFFSPMNFNRDWLRDNVVFSLHFRAGVRQHCISRSPGGFFMKSSCYLIPHSIHSQDPDQIPIYPITYCLPK